jgi:hypothetical protein
VSHKGLIILGVLAAVIVGYVAFIIPNFRHRAEWKRTVRALQSLPHDRIEAAVQAFKRDREITDGIVPLRQLVSAGYLRAEDVQSLRDRDVLVSLATDETTPHVWIRVQGAGGDIVLMADGSIRKEARR